MPPRGHACAGGDRDEGAGQGQDSPNEAPRGSLCGCYDGGGGEKVVEKKLVSSEYTDHDTAPRATEIFSRVRSAHAKKRGTPIQDNRSIIVVRIVPRKSNPHSLIVRQARRMRHAPDTRAAPSDGLSGREGLAAGAGIRGSTVQRLSSAVLTATAAAATTALDVVIDAGGNPLCVVVALQGFECEGRHAYALQKI